MTEAEAQKYISDAGLMHSQSGFLDAKTGEVVPEAQARIRLQAAQAHFDAINAGTLPAYRQGLINNGQTVAGAAVTRANADQQSVNQTGVYQQGELGLGAGRLSVQQGELGLNTQKYLSPNTAGGKNGLTATQDDAMAKESLGNAQAAARLQHMLNTGKGPDGTTALSGADQAMMHQQVLSYQQRNAEINRRRESAMPALNGAAPGTVNVRDGQGGYSGPIPNSQADFQRMTPQQKYDYKNIYLKSLNSR